MDYPCSVCALECNDDIHQSIECSNCKNWVHSDCANMNSNEMKSWSADHLSYVCKCCAFSGNTYDASAALSRLHGAMVKDSNKRLSNRRKALLNQAESEEKLLKTYKVTVSKCDNMTYTIDDQSVAILDMFQPVMNTVYDPVRTVGDGNCLYRAVSSVITGDENNHILLRLLTAIEFINHRYAYDTQKTHNDFLNDCRIVTSSYDKLVSDTLSINTYSEMAHIYAMSAALNEPIQSYFPPHIKQHELSSAFTRTVVGRGVSTDVTPKIKLMWTSMRVPPTLNTFQANHFVPLVEKKLDQGEKRNSIKQQPQSDFNADNSTPDISATNSVDYNDFPLYDSDIPNSFGQGIGCETLDDPVTISGITAHDIVSGSTGDSPPHPSGGSDSSSSAQPVESDMHGVLDSGFLDTGNVITHLLKDVPGLAHIPPGSKENVYFILDNNVNQDKRSNNKRSAFSDDRGIWNSSSGASPKSHYVMHENGDLTLMHLKNGQFCSKKVVKKHAVFTPIVPQPQKEQIVVLHRYYTTLKKDKGYKKKVTWLGEGGLESSLALVEYVGKWPGHAPHGLSTDDGQQYIRRPDYVMDDIERLTKEKRTPADIFLTLQECYDETTRPDLETIYQKRRHVKVKTAERDGRILTTNFADQTCHLENLVADNDDFVRASIRTGGKTPTFALYTDEQLDDIQKFCCTGQTFLGVDKTFNLCRMHKTVTCFKQLSVTTDRTSEPPLFLGPMFIHDNSDYEIYSHLFHRLRLRLGPNLAKLVIGCDDEQAMVKAILAEFPCSSHVLCTRHLKENTRHYMTTEGVNEKDRQVILEKIYGTDGLVDATDDVCFDMLCDEIVDYADKCSSKFAQYFSKRLRPSLKSKVNDPVREGIIPRNWTNNNCESINHVLKQTTVWESKSLPELVRLTKRLVKGQYSELRSAILSTGKYRLAATHKHFGVSKAEWIDMTESQRTKLYQRFRHFVPRDERLVTSTDGLNTVVAPKTDGKKPGQRKRKINVRTVTVTKKAKGD